MRTHHCRVVLWIAFVASVLLIFCLPVRGGEPDLHWNPRPFVFESGPSVKYIDFENGADNGPGTREQPWKHHPWDANATGAAAACTGIHTYCFKKGVVYRGSLVARESGKPGNPIRLTVDPSWGTGPAGLYGSVRIRGGWQRCKAAACPEIPETSCDKTWYIDLEKGFTPRLLCEVRNGRATRIPIARTPNWQVTNPDDPRSEWWEFTGSILELRVELEDATGFRKGDSVSSTGKWLDVDENKDNIDASRNTVLEVGDTFIRIASRAWKKGEIQKGEKITNGRSTTTVKRVSNVWENTAWLIDTAHLNHPNADRHTGATLWVERGPVMPNPVPRVVQAFSPDTHAIYAWAGNADKAPGQYNRYYLEGLPQYLDKAGKWCCTATAKSPGRLYLRLSDDRDPNNSDIEAAREIVLVDIRNKHHIEVAGLELMYVNPIAPEWPSRPPSTRPYAVTVHVLGDCSHISVRHCRIGHVGYGFTAMPEKDGDVLDHIEVRDNDIHDVDGSAIHLRTNHWPLYTRKAKVRLIHVRILRNRFFNTGARVIQPKALGRDTVDVFGGEMVEIAGNIVDRSYGGGIRVHGVHDFSHTNLVHPLMRIRIHHNKVTNSLLALQDWGGIASWQIGPSYVYNNISGNPVGYKHTHWRRLRTGDWQLGETRRENWHRRSCYGIGIYLDGQYKGYAFNNIAWGKNNNVDDRIYNSCAFNEAQGFMNTVFNNTFYNFGVGLHKGMTQHNRCYYLGNLMLDMGNYFIRQETKDENTEYRSLAFARNIFQGNPFRFGKIGRRDIPENFFGTLGNWTHGIRQRGVMVAETGTHVTTPQVQNASAHDFRPRPAAAAIDAGVKVFVPWSLYAVVGEWGFFQNRTEPGRILGEHINRNEEYVHRNMCQDIPRHDLTGHGIDASNYRPGTLEDWVNGALVLNGVDEYCALPVAEVKRDYTWQDAWNGKTGSYPGDKRVGMDMGTSNFLIEAVLKTAPGITRGGIAGTCEKNGYVLDIAANGALRMSLRSGDHECSRTSSALVNDGQWHHIIAEVDRKKPETIALYIDGKPANGKLVGNLPAAAPLSNSADFLVGKTPGPDAAFLAGQLDFLRVSRGTLADAETTIEELYDWEFNGPFLRDFYGRKPTGKRRDAGALEYHE